MEQRQREASSSSSENGDSDGDERGRVVGELALLFLFGSVAFKQ